jgi:immunity protein 53 of polymorphic toxin system
MTNVSIDQSMSTITALQRWYEAQCNGDWEHDSGIDIGTLDNPGWTVTINLVGTALEDQEFQAVEDLASESDWIKCWIENATFRGVGGPQKLEEILQIFLHWGQAESV